MPRSFCTTAASVGASSLPLTSVPRRSRTEYSKVLVAVLIAPSSAPPRQPVVVLDVVALLEALLVRDAPRAHELGQVLVQRVHPVLGACLHGGVDLVRLALADEVADGGCRDHDLGRDDAGAAVRRPAQRL